MKKRLKNPRFLLFRSVAEKQSVKCVLNLCLLLFVPYWAELKVVPVEIPRFDWLAIYSTASVVTNRQQMFLAGTVF